METTTERKMAVVIEMRNEKRHITAMYVNPSNGHKQNDMHSTQHIYYSAGN